MTTPYIFPGLKQPTSQLYFDLQAFIAANGGRLRLAEIIEGERLERCFKKNCFYCAEMSRPKSIEISIITKQSKEVLSRFQLYRRRKKCR